MDESEVLRFEQQKQITKLSQAIREGAKLRPQCTTGFFFDGKSSCALGAAYEAVFGKPSPRCDFNVTGAIKDFGINVPYSITGRIMAWNDVDKLSREAIADKLEAEGL